MLYAPRRRSSRSRVASTPGSRRRSARCCMPTAGWQAPAGSVLPRGFLEQRQVPVELPLRDLLVRSLPFATLDLDEVIDVIAVAGLAQRLSQHVILLELAGGVEQIARQQVDALGGALLG